ncbi:uncharacterized protein LOC118514406 [Anopheles stephensi]|uniref:Uncharacterized protein n=1 Tax=Anopheles stephensi TaxID=30069 RepID=A0A182YJ69_ANOST|nr:uncharacterized protein LOC118514406 [Anopheles stephensi]
MKSAIIALVLFAAIATQTLALPTDCVKHSSNVDRHTVRLYDCDGLNYELGSNCLSKYFHPTEVQDYPRRSCNCGKCDTCRDSHYPCSHYPYSHYPYSHYPHRYGFAAHVGRFAF